MFGAPVFMDAPAAPPIPDTPADAAGQAASPAPIPAPAAAADSAKAPASPSPRHAWRVLTTGPFGRYVAGDSVSMVGLWMQTTAQGVVMTGLTASPSEFGWLQFFGSIPTLLLMIFGGTIADRFDKRRIIILAQIIQIILAATMGMLIWKGQVQVWQIMAATFLLGTTGAFEMPAASALVPELVAREDFGVAIAADRAIFHASRLVGPGIAGWLIAALGPASAFFANALSFLPSIAAIASIQPRTLGTKEEEEERSSGILAGLRYLRGDRPTVAMLALIAANALWIFPFVAVMMPLYATELLGHDPRGLSYLMMVAAAGALAASGTILLIPRERRVGWLTVSAGVICVSLCGLAMARTLLQAAGSLLTLSVGTSLTFALTNTTIQERAPGPMRGRVSSLSALSFIGVIPFAALAVGKLSDHVGLRTGMFIGAAGYALCALFIFLGPARRMNDVPPGPVPPPAQV